MALTYSPPEGATVVSGGNWIAIKDTDGKTYYQSASNTGESASVIYGSEKYTGPIIISAGNLTVAPGAEASGAYVSGGWNTIYVQSGGTLESSTNVNGWTYTSDGGVSSDNTLVSDGGTVFAGGTSIDDSILAGSAQDGGADTFHIASDAYVSGNMVVGNNATLDATQGNAYIESPIEVAPGGTLKITSAGTTVGTGEPHSGLANTHADVVYPTAPDGATYLSGGNWIAFKGDDGKTYYQSATGAGSGASTIDGASVYGGPVILSGGNLTVASDAVASGAYVSGWSSIYIQSGGTLESSANMNGWTYVSSGGVAFDDTLVSDAGVVRNGGTSLSNIFIGGSSEDGGSDTVSVESGAIFSGKNVNGPGGILNITSGATIAEPITNYITEPHSGYISGAYVSGGSWIAYKGDDGKTYYQSATTTGEGAAPVDGAERYTGPIIISGGDLTVAPGAVASGAYVSGGNKNIFIQSGGTLESSVHVNGWTYVSSGAVSTDNLLMSDVGTVYSGGTSLNDSLLAGSSYDGGGDRDPFNVSGGGLIADPYIGSDSVLNIYSGATSIAPTLQVGATYNLQSAQQSAVCFLPGSLIRTPAGDVAIETLNPGDMVMTYVNGVAVPDRITWAGQARCKIDPDLSDDLSGYPVRILKDALSRGNPSKDMLITSEHCLLLEGQFVPVRMLVNGRSIFYDKSVKSYDYYHIETETHSVIMADGVLTESYLDTGNRSKFRQKGNVFAHKKKQKQSWDEAAAPLNVSREFVEPIFRRLQKRAEQEGVKLQSEVPLLTNESDLHLLTNLGEVIRPSRQVDNHFMFKIPAGVYSVRIISNVSRPCDVIGPFVDDRRQLGVLVGAVAVFECDKTWSVTAHLQDELLSGWSVVENGSMRWTEGKAELPLGDREVSDVALLSLQVVAGGPYIVSNTESQAEVLRA